MPVPLVAVGKKAYIQSDNKTYLGDGVYVESNNHEIILTTENGIEIVNTIYLDIDVTKKLLDVIRNFINTFDI